MTPISIEKSFCVGCYSPKKEILLQDLHEFINAALKNGDDLPEFLPRLSQKLSEYWTNLLLPANPDEPQEKLNEGELETP
jgi:hypothetical protein